MADPNQPHHPTDDDLLANAIPIEEIEEIEEVEPEQTSSPAGTRSIDLADPAGHKDIKIFGRKETHSDNWKRSPNATGQGAVHIRTFVSKLRLDAIENLDRQINEWLDGHPEYEVKFVTTNIGELTGKAKEPALFMSVWV